MSLQACTPVTLYVCVCVGVCVWVCPLVCVMQSRVKKQQQIKRVAPFASLHMYLYLYLYPYLCVVCKDIERLIKLRQLDGQLLDNETQPTGDCQQACHSPQPPLPPPSRLFPPNPFNPCQSQPISQVLVKCRP